MKLLVLAGSAVSLVMALRYIEREDMARFEFSVLILLATVGMMMMISANDMLALYLGLELQSLSLYVVAAFRRDHLRSSRSEERRVGKECVSTCRSRCSTSH